MMLVLPLPCQPNGSANRHVLETGRVLGGAGAGAGAGTAVGGWVPRLGTQACLARSNEDEAKGE